MITLELDEFESPVGSIAVFTDGTAICHLDFTDCQDRIQSLLQRRFGQFRTTIEKNPFKIRDCMDRYFDGDSKAFDHVPLKTGGTDFQRIVWRSLLQIPFGSTWSYAELAMYIKRKSAIRAVAGANAKNPIAIIIPCHRVIASDGSLAGYAGGVHRKQWLLVHET